MILKIAPHRAGTACILSVVLIICFSGVAGAISQKEKDVIESLNKLDFRLNKKRLKAAAYEREIKEIRARGERNRASERVLLQEIRDLKDYALRRLVVFYKLNQMGLMSIFTSAESLSDFLETKIYINKILEHDDIVLKNFLNKVLKLKDIRAELDGERNAKELLEAELLREIAGIEVNIAKREKMLTRIRRNRALREAAVAAAGKSAKKLGREFSRLSKARGGRGRAGRRFSRYRGRLPRPVEGEVVLGFGAHKDERFNVSNYSSGIEIKAARGEPVRVVFGGRVAHVSWVKSYGNVMIVDHGAHYYTLYAHVEETFKKVGESVDGSEVVATVGDTGSITGPKLRFEIRHRGRPINPARWLKKG